MKRQIEGELRVCIHHIYISRPLFEPSTDVQPEATGAKRPPDANSNKKFPLHYEAYQVRRSQDSYFVFLLIVNFPHNRRC